MKRLDRARLLLAGAFLVALVATAGSLNFSGIGPLGWRGMGLFPCELCWYQRILMYPIPILLGIALARRDASIALYVLPLAALGIAVASYHVAIQLRPAIEAGQCFVGSCTAVDYRFLGRFSIPQLSLAGFASVAALLAGALLARKR